MKFPEIVLERVTMDNLRPSQPSPHREVIMHALDALTLDDLMRAIVASPEGRAWAAEAEKSGRLAALEEAANACRARAKEPNGPVGEAQWELMNMADTLVAMKSKPEKAR
jgi:hypothetical protein